MSSSLSVLVGPARCGKTQALLDGYCDVLRCPPTDGGFGRALWIAPNARTAAAIRERLIDLGAGACLAPGVTTFDSLADEVLSTLDAPPRKLSPALERALLRRVVDAANESNKLNVLRNSARHASFVQLLDDHFDELERRGIRPAKFAKLKGFRGDRAQHAELAHLYGEYTRLLDEHRLVDLESRLIACHAALAGDKRNAILGKLELVVVDGFSDFSAVQLDLLEELARRTAKLTIALASDDGRETKSATGRADLFAKSAATLAELRRRFPRLKTETLPARESDWPAMDHVERNLFRHPRELSLPTPATEVSIDRIEIIEAAGAQNEIVQLARTIKRELLAGRSRPGDIVVVFRHLHEAAPRVRAVFSAFGIPYSLESGLPLASTGVVRTILDLVRLDAEDWPFRRVVGVVANNLLATISRRDRAAAEWLVRNLQVASGRETLLTRVDRLASEAASAAGAPDAAPTHYNHLTRSAAQAQPVLHQLSNELAQLPTEASPTAWSAALTHLGNRLGIAALGDTPTDDDLTLENRVAWQHVVDHFAALERLSAWLGEPPPQLSRRELLETLVDVAANERLPRPHDDVGRVRVLSAATARTVAARHLFLAGMSEQAFPSPERAGRLYSEADYAAFARAADQAIAESDAAAVRRPQEEMLLFYEVVTRATDRLTISYAALDEKAQALPPSPYVTELERTFGATKVRRHGAPRPSPLPPDEPPLSPADWRIGAVAGAVLADPPQLASLARLFTEPSMRDVAASIDAALRTIADRARWSTFGPHEGILASDAIRGRLARRFGKDHLWSPSQFESYARCPFNFLMQDVLGLEPVGELVLETDPRHRGALLHQVLADFHRERPQLFAASRQPTEKQFEQFVTEFTNVVEALARATPYSGVEAALAELDRLRVRKWAPQYFAQHTGYRDAQWPALDEPLAPAHFEWRFGPPRSGEGDAEDPRSTAEPFLFDLGDEQICVAGRIDRIDVGRRGDKTVFNVIDYKSGKRPSLVAEKIESGERLQPALYVMAAQALLFGPNRSIPLWAGYWSMREGVTTRPNYSLQCSADGDTITEAWESLQTKIKDRVRQMVADIRAGLFPVSSRDDHCTSYCDFRTVCRVAQTRALDKPWPPVP